MDPFLLGLFGVNHGTPNPSGRCTTPVPAAVTTFEGKYLGGGRDVRPGARLLAARPRGWAGGAPRLGRWLHQPTPAAKHHLLATALGHVTAPRRLGGVPGSESVLKQERVSRGPLSRSSRGGAPTRLPRSQSFLSVLRGILPAHSTERSVGPAPGGSSARGAVPTAGARGGGAGLAVRFGSGWRERGAGGPRLRAPPARPCPLQNSRAETKAGASEKSAARHTPCPPDSAVPRSREMRRGWGLLPRALLLLLALVTLPGDGNEGSVAGSCHCSKVLSNFHAEDRFMDHLRKYGKTYHRCRSYIRFELRSQSVCGGSQDQWVLALMSCFDRGECGRAHRKNVVYQKHFSPRGTPIPRPTEGTPPDRSTPPQKGPVSASKSTLKPTRLPGTRSLDKGLSHFNETTTPTSGYNLETGHQVKQNQKKLEEKASATGGGPSAVVPIVSLLAIVFFLIVIILYMKCRRSRKQSPQYSPAVMALI